jgi:hypothetical protein
MTGKTKENNGNRTFAGLGTAALSGVAAIAATLDRPRDGIRVVDAVLMTVTGDRVAVAVLLHALAVSGLAYALFRLISLRFGILTSGSSTIVVVAAYLYLYLTWGVPMVR